MPPKRGKGSQQHNSTADDIFAISGSISKLKGAIRSTRRLLDKEVLQADERVTTERRLETLQYHLDKLLQSEPVSEKEEKQQQQKTHSNNGEKKQKLTKEEREKEKKLARKYHMLKFVERKKLVRKIKQELSTKDSSTHDLQNLRIDLNYVLNYPKDRKYISLFPNNSYVPFSTSQASSSKSKEKRNEEEEDDTQIEQGIQRDSIRQSIRQQMESGKLSNTPDIDLQNRPPPPKKKRKAGNEDNEKDDDNEDGEDEDVEYEDNEKNEVDIKSKVKSKPVSKRQKLQQSKKTKSPFSEKEADDFFE